MSETVEIFTDSNFEDKVEKSNVLTIVDFWAGWCSPCHMISPIIAELAEENRNGIKIGKLNVDENPITFAKYEIRSIPTVLFFKDGEVKDQLVGVTPKNLIQSVIDKNR